MNVTSLAAVMTGFEQPLEMREYPVPAELETGETLVRVEMAGICGTDVHLWQGQLPIPVPVILGHETVGRIERIGGGPVKDWTGATPTPGDRIAWASGIMCGQCYYCRQKQQPTRCLSRKAYGISYNANESPHLRGGYSQYILLRRGTAMFKLPDGLATEAIVGAGCALTTALHGFDRAPIRMGDTVVVQGAGPVGMAALAVAKEAGASKTIIIGAPDHRLTQAREFGADETISIEAVPSAEERRKLVLNLTGGYGADYVAECVGYPAAVPEGLELCRDGATYLVLGQYGNAGDVPLNPHTITRKQLKLVGSWGFEPRHVHQAIDFLQIGNWQRLFAQQVTHRFSLAQANEALATVRRHASGKAVIVP